MNTLKNAKRKPLNVTLPEGLLQEFKAVCQQRGAEYSATVESCLRAWIDLAGKAQYSNLPPLVFKTMSEIEGKPRQPVNFYPTTPARQVKAHRDAGTAGKLAKTKGER